MSTGCPYRCTGTTAVVRGVTAGPTAAVSMRPLLSGSPRRPAWRRVAHGLGGGDERVGRHDDVVSGVHSGGDSASFTASVPELTPIAWSTAAEVREGLLELRQLGPHGVGGPLDDRTESSVEAGAQILGLALEIDEGHAHSDEIVAPVPGGGARDSHVLPPVGLSANPSLPRWRQRQNQDIRLQVVPPGYSPASKRRPERRPARLSSGLRDCLLLGEDKRRLNRLHPAAFMRSSRARRLARRPRGSPAPPSQERSPSPC